MVINQKELSPPPQAIRRTTATSVARTRVECFSRSMRIEVWIMWSVRDPCQMSLLNREWPPDTRGMAVVIWIRPLKRRSMQTWCQEWSKSTNGRINRGDLGLKVAEELTIWAWTLAQSFSTPQHSNLTVYTKVKQISQLIRLLRIIN